MQNMQEIFLNSNDEGLSIKLLEKRVFAKIPRLFNIWKIHGAIV